MTATRVASVAVRAALGAIALGRLASAATPREPVTASPDGSAHPHSISVVVPARDEAANIGTVVDALRDAPGVGELIVVDDGSTDGTAEIARRHGARVVAAGPLPPGWAGKPWAVHRGIESCTGTWVVTVDADARPARSLPAALVARATRDATDFVTVAGTFDGASPGARWFHPAMLATLVYRFGVPGRARCGMRTRILANGQCMALRRAPFAAAGGMSLVGGEIVEDVALARSLAAHGLAVDFLDAGELLTVGLYGSLRETWHGWGRSIALPGIEPRWRTALDLAMLTTAMPLPLARVVAGRGDALDALLLIARVGTLLGTARAYVTRGAAYWLSPLADPLAVAAIAASASRRQVTWRSRSYRLAGLGRSASGSPPFHEPVEA